MKGFTLVELLLAISGITITVLWSWVIVHFIVKF
jgi:prepilin-type N-terminal cleavage/methylation domain-containing protein